MMDASNNAEMVKVMAAKVVEAYTSTFDGHEYPAEMDSAIESLVSFMFTADFDDPCNWIIHSVKDRPERLEE